MSSGKQRGTTRSSSNAGGGAGSVGGAGGIFSTLAFRVLAFLLLTSLLLQFALLQGDDNVHVASPDRLFRGSSLGVQQEEEEEDQKNPQQALRKEQQQKQEKGNIAHHNPHIPYLPTFAPIPNADTLAADTLAGKPTVAGVAAIMTNFLLDVHAVNRRLGLKKNPKPERDEVYTMFHSLASKHLLPFDAAYRNQPIFPIRDDDSVFMSLASYRDHLLGQTLREAFGKAQNPHKLYIGAVVQNCFGVERTCRTGVQVVGKMPNGQPKTQVSDAPPDINGVEDFCSDSQYKQYCDSGQVRALYVNETESVGPAVARYFASKLWGGETYYVQSDAHLQFAQHWDTKYITEVKATKNYPKSILSSYPPGFDGKFGDDSRGTRLCSCVFSTSDVENQIIRINLGSSYGMNEDLPKRPTQIPFMAAGFFFAHAQFLVDVPFDPLLPWCFMGEEIALSMRSWTAGWNMYAPRHNLIAHQYRPGRMGLPKFWESVGRTYNRPGAGFNTQIQRKAILRLKNMLGYVDCSKEVVEKDGHGIVLTELEHYGMGTERTREEYLDWTGIDMKEKKCKNIPWCNRGELE